MFLFVCLLIGPSIVLFLVSRGKWSDAIIDSGREWIVPDALARGNLLYLDVVYWFGPFTPYFHAAFFRLFGSSFRTLVLAGLVGSLGVLASLFFASGRTTARREAAAWAAFLASFSPLLIYHGQDVRMYALLVVCQLGYLWFFTRIWQGNVISIVPAHILVGAKHAG